MLKPSIHFPYPAWGRWGVWADHINLGERRGTPCKGRHSIIRLTQKDNSFSPRWHTHTHKQDLESSKNVFRSHLIIEFNLFFKYTDRLIEFHKCKCPHILNTFSPGLYRIIKNYSLNLKRTASSSVVVHRLWGKLFESQRRCSSLNLTNEWHFLLDCALYIVFPVLSGPWIIVLLLCSPSISLFKDAH